jgi:death-on-curing protein
VTVWISKRLVLAIHDEQLREHGGAGGVRDDGLLESALARPVNRAAYAGPDIAEFGALYAVGIARNHPFIDGNKRAAFAALTTFLDLNGFELRAAEAEAVVAMLALAAGELDDEMFIQWVREHVSAAPDED